MTEADRADVADNPTLQLDSRGSVLIRTRLQQQAKGACNDFRELSLTIDTNSSV